MQNKIIKFRAIDTSGNVRFGSIVSDKEKPVAIIQQIENPINYGCANGWCFAVKPETVSMFTGLIDKNGKEAYEGDTCKEPNGSEFTIVFDTHTFRGDLDTEITVIGWLRKWKDGTFSPIGFYGIKEFEIIETV